MQSNELTYQIALTLLDGIGDVLAKNLIAYCGSAEQVFKTKSSVFEKIPGIGSVLAKSIVNNKDLVGRAEKEMKFMQDKGIEPLFFTDKKYPHRLKHCHDGPVMLYYKGNADLNATKIVSVVGTRTPSLYGKGITEKLMEDLRNSGVLVVSGLAYGIDITAHKAALDNGLETVGVLAHGLDRIYPSEHKAYAKHMIGQGGLLTEHISETNPDRENFPKRNRIVAGMCDAVIVIESKRGGGSLITATIANAYNKDVFAFPGKVGDALSEGCNGLIKTNKASLIESAADLFYIMNWNEEKKSEKKTKQIPLPLRLSADEQKIVDAFAGKSQLHIDEICYVTSFPTSKASSCLLQLEFSNIISSFPGKLYSLKTSF
jgi:DNA processing protein